MDKPTFKRKVEIEETKYIAMGDSYCQFEVKPKKTDNL